MGKELAANGLPAQFPAEQTRVDLEQHEIRLAGEVALQSAFDLRCG